MANKVVQLQNKEGDNLYPLSGGTASDSITTDMLQDGSVTSDKIDFATTEWKTVPTNIANATLAYRITANKILEVRFSAISNSATIPAGINSIASIPAELQGRLQSATRAILIPSPYVMFEVLPGEFRLWNIGSATTAFFQANVVAILD